MQDGSNPKQLIAEKIKQSANILVTVSSNPSVDALTASLGLTLMLNKLDKHATAVFSGVIPPAINFLEPTKTFENNVDSLRDFIIALDKDKADRLRYKVEDDVVRIFITPYRTKILQSDLQFSQGDFNVDLIVALGVEDQKDLDQAITAHGRILHDAAVVTINAAEQKSSLGSVDWQDRKVSSLSEMLVSLAEMLKPGILDQQISTALLTGIVASTERFSNQHTTPHVMTMAAQLMAAGANQQLIATKLQSIPAPVSPRREKPKAVMPEAGKKVSAEPAESDGEMHITHSEEKHQPAPLPLEPEQAPAPEQGPELEPEPELAIAPPPAQNFDDLKEAIGQDTVQAAPQREMAEEPPTPGSHNINDAENDAGRHKPEEESYLTTHPSWQGREIKPPSMGGTLSATAEQALEDKMREESEDTQNRTILTHGGPAAPVPSQSQPQQQSSSNSKRRKKNRQSQQQNQPKQQAPAAPVPKAPEPTPPAPEPAPAPTPVPEPVSAPEPVQSQPAMEIPAPVEQPVEPALLPAAEPLQPVEPAAPAPEVPASTPESASAAPPAPAAHEPTLEELEREATQHAAQAVAPQTLSELEAARQQTDAAFTPPAPQSAAPTLQPLSTPVPAPQSEVSPTGLPPLPPMPDFSTLPPIPGAAPELPQQPLQQPMAPQLPQELTPPPAAPTPPPSTPPAPTDPGQFRIPG